MRHGLIKPLSISSCHALPLSLLLAIAQAWQGPLTIVMYASRTSRTVQLLQVEWGPLSVACWHITCILICKQTGCVAEPEEKGCLVFGVAGNSVKLKSRYSSTAAAYPTPCLVLTALERDSARLVSAHQISVHTLVYLTAGKRAHTKILQQL